MPSARGPDGAGSSPEIRTSRRRSPASYLRIWDGEPLGRDEYVLSADEKTQAQIRQRRHPITPPAPGRAMRVEHEYRRHGTRAYIAAWDVHRAKLFGRVAERSTLESFDGLVAEVMAQEPYRSAKRVFWVVDNGTVHRGPASVCRLRDRWPKLVLVHLPIHASWLNQVEIYFSVLQRKALSPDDFRTPEAIEARILAFQAHYQREAKPFRWRFTRQDLDALLIRCSTERANLPAAA